EAREGGTAWRDSANSRLNEANCSRACSSSRRSSSASARERVTSVCTASNVALSSWTCACKLCSELLSELTWGAVVLGALCCGAPATATALGRHAIATSSALFETERILDRFIDRPPFLLRSRNIVASASVRTCPYRRFRR